MNQTRRFFPSLSTHPLREWEGFQRMMDRFFDDAAVRGTAAFEPKCEVTEDKTHYFFKFDLPGIPKDAIKIELNENQLTVSGERRQETEKRQDDEKSHFSEVHYGSFMRSFTLPTPVDAEKTAANYDAGVLKLSVAKAQPSHGRQIAIR